MQPYVFIKNLQRPVHLNTTGLEKAHLKVVVFGFAWGHVVNACSVSMAFSLPVFQCTILLFFFFDHFR